MKATITATCAICGRRYRSPGETPWCSVGCAAEAYHEPEPTPAPDVGRGRAARTVRRPLSPREIPDPSAAR